MIVLNSEGAAEESSDEVDDLVTKFQKAPSNKESLANQELEQVFSNLNDFKVNMSQSKVKQADLDEFKDQEQDEREELPFYRDPKKKISFWTILKDSIGKDISKMSVPVYFNDPTNILQKCCVSMEYADLVGKATDESDSLMRLAYVAAYSVTYLTVFERNVTKPFNPLLGETFEFRCKFFDFIAE